VPIFIGRGAPVCDFPRFYILQIPNQAADSGTWNLPGSIDPLVDSGSKI
jgi:hypothetical protein